MRRRRQKKEESTWAVIYCRVSSKEQTENYSLTSQEAECRRFAERDGLEVVKLFVNRDGESAKTVERQALQEMIRYVSNRANKIGTVIVWKYDRLSRNMKDFSDLHASFAKLHIKVLSATETNGDDSASLLLRNITGAFAQFENDVKSERTIAGMKRATEEGRWVCCAPLGYTFRKDELGKSKLYPNEKAKYIRMAYEMYTSGAYTQAEIVRAIKAEGYSTIYKQKLGYILRNPVYAGWIDKPDWFPQRVKGIHEALVDEDVWQRTQLLLDGRKPNTAPQLRNNPDFPLRKFVSCGECEVPLTGGFSTSRSKARHPYYRCSAYKCGSGSIRRDILHEQFIELLNRVRVSPTIWRLFDAIVRDAWSEYSHRESSRQLSLRKRTASKEAERTKIVRLFALEKLTECAYKDASGVIETELADIRAERSEFNFDEKLTDECVGACREMLTEPAVFWESAGIRGKQRFQKAVFPHGLSYSGGKLGTALTSTVFSTLGRCEGDLSNMAPAVGLEPTTR